MEEKNILTLGIFAHANAGKTTLTEQLLYHMNVNKQVGRVDHGTTTTDNLSVEKERGISVRSAMVTFNIGDKLVQLIDTPGHIDFTSEVERAVNVLDGAILVISAVEGVEPQTKVIWDFLRERNIPTIIYINKIDRMGADYNRVLSEIKKKLTDKVVNMQNVYVDSSTHEIKCDNVAEDVLVDDLAEIDEQVMELYLNDEEISTNFLNDRINHLSQNGEIFCVYGGSALLNCGVENLISAISEKLPGIVEEKKNFSGYVYCIRHDETGKKTFIKVLNGQLENRDVFEINDEVQKIRTLYRVVGDKTIKCDSLRNGEIGIVTGLDVQVGDILGEVPENLKIIRGSQPLFYANVTALEEQKLQLVKALTELNEEDPNLNFKYDSITHKVCVDLMGRLQIEILSNLISERYGIQPIFSDMLIIKKETPQSIGVGSACYNGLSEVEFTISPLPRGSGLVFKSTVSTDYLYTKYQKQIEKLVKFYSNQGLFGWQVEDAEICLSGGKSDSVCSSSAHYNVVTPLAFMRALKNADMHIMEPIMNYLINIDEVYCNDILKILASCGLNYDIIRVDECKYNITGYAPLRVLIEIQPLITKITNGFGTIIKKTSGYDISYNDFEEKEFIGLDPRDEEMFLMEMKVKPEMLGEVKKLVKDKRSKRERSMERRNKRY